MDDQLWLKADKADVIELLNLKADKATTYTVIEVDGKLVVKDNVRDVNIAAALQVDKSYVDGHLALKADQDTTYTKMRLIFC